MGDEMQAGEAGRDAAAARWKQVPVLNRKHKDEGYLEGSTMCGKIA